MRNFRVSNDHKILSRTDLRSIEALSIVIFYLLIKSIILFQYFRSQTYIVSVQFHFKYLLTKVNGEQISFYKFRQKTMYRQT